MEEKQGNTIIQMLAKSGMPLDAMWSNPALYIDIGTTIRLLALHELYKKILHVAGDIYVFGVHWGQDLMWLHQMRALYEPWTLRRIIGFDTFCGFPSVSEKDGGHIPGEFCLPENYAAYLSKIIEMSEGLVYPDPPRHVLVVGDVCATLPKYLEDHPGATVAFAWIDIDLYEPTKVCLKQIESHAARGAVVGLDDMFHPDWPGVGAAFQEVWGKRYALRRWEQSRTIHYCVVD